MFASSPKLIAGSYVLHRLLTPRHPPDALSSLNKNTLDSYVYYISIVWSLLLHIKTIISKKDRLFLRFQRTMTSMVIHNQIVTLVFAALDAIPKNPSGSFKEVIQPQVPLRLPCYDFTPIIEPTVGASFQKVRHTTSG